MEGLKWRDEEGARYIFLVGRGVFGLCLLAEAANEGEFGDVVAARRAAGKQLQIPHQHCQIN